MAVVCARYCMHPSAYWELTNEDHTALVDYIRAETKANKRGR